MAKADRQPKQESRPLLANVRVTAAERSYMQKVASSRSMSVSDLMREALRKEGALPS